MAAMQGVPTRLGRMTGKQFHEFHGRVCPAGCRTREADMKADTVAVAEWAGNYATESGIRDDGPTLIFSRSRKKTHGPPLIKKSHCTAEQDHATRTRPSGTLSQTSIEWRTPKLKDAPFRSTAGIPYLPHATTIKSVLAIAGMPVRIANCT